MPPTPTPHSLITGTGHHVPERVVTNQELVDYVGGSADWVFQRTGILQRRWARASESTTDLGEAAARLALADAKLAPHDLDALIFATLSPDFAFPGCGTLLQDRLGVQGLPALDVRNQCSGYLYALSVADAWVRAGVYGTVLVVGAEIHSAGLDFSEEGRPITMLFGDGAGAVVVEAGGGERQGGRVVDVRLGADGAGAGHLSCLRPGSAGGIHISVEDIRQKRHFPTMNGRQVFRRAIETLTREVTTLVQDHQLERDRLLLIPHQANRRINEHLATQLGLAPHQVVHTIETYGNTTAASIPMALDVARTTGLMPPGTQVVHAAFGSGYTWGTALVAF